MEKNRARGLSPPANAMVRGHAKQVAQEKNAAKQKAAKGTQRFDAAKKLTVVCPICRTSVVNYAMLMQHYDAKHPKEKSRPPESDFS